MDDPTIEWVEFTSFYHKNCSIEVTFMMLVSKLLGNAWKKNHPEALREAEQ